MNEEERRHLSKVTFSPISSDVLCVRIRTVSPEARGENISAMSSASLQVPGNHGNSEDSLSVTPSHSRSRKTGFSSPRKTHKGKSGNGKTANVHDDCTPCLRHAAENIGRKAVDIPSEKVSLCNSCSKSMLSYIFLVQDFLDSLAKEIGGGDSSCLQCARQEVRSSVAAKDRADEERPISEAPSREYPESRQKDNSDSRPAHRRTASKTKAHRQENKRNEVSPKGTKNSSHEVHGTGEHQKPEFVYNVFPPSSRVQSEELHRVVNKTDEKDATCEYQSSEQHRDVSEQQSVEFHHTLDQHGDRNIRQQRTEAKDVITNKEWTGASDAVNNQQENFELQENFVPHLGGAIQLSENETFRVPMERRDPNYDAPGLVEQSTNEPHDALADSPTLFNESVDGIVSALSNIDREVYDNARDRAGWEGLTETEERSVPLSGNSVSSEAFVTSCRNNAEAIGCLVVGTSLLLCRTTKKLCVLVSEGVSTAFRDALSSVFPVVQYVRSLDSLGTTKLALLEQPELGVTFEKLNIWRLVQFTKCVYLNPDTLVIQNCDELFCREELSAVPDIGWPDCFNSGVFVYSPSVNTFWQLVEFAEKQGSYDGGDQGLLNSYFSSWSTDISKKLSFIYNLMANVSYTYTPAFRQFGREIKIVQFHGSFKPWHVKFFSKSGQISPSSTVHPTYVQFVHIWLSIFRISVLRLMSREIQTYATSQEIISAVEILRFFPLPTESEAEFFLTPPSVRLRLNEKKLQRSAARLPISEARRRKSAEFFKYTEPEEEIPEAVSDQQKYEEDPKVEEKSHVSSAIEDRDKAESDTNLEDVFKGAEAEEVVEVKKKVRGRNALPGSEMGNYHGMKAWEQGRMDYEGTDSSDNVIKRLQFLISKP